MGHPAIVIRAEPMAEEPEQPPGWTVVIGIVLGVGASIGINVGNNIMAIALAMHPSPEDVAAVKRRKKVLVCGTTLFAVASVINFVAFAFAPASVLAPLEAIQFVSNLVFNRFVNKRQVTRRMVIGSALIVLGVVCAVVCGPKQVAKFEIDQLVKFWQDLSWIVFLSVAAALALGCHFVNRHYKRSVDEGQPLRGHRAILPATFAWSSASIGAIAVIQSKTMSELVELAFSDGFRPLILLESWFFHFSLVLLLVSLIGWLYRLAAALKRFDPLFIIPLLQSNYILLSTIAGGIYFQEFEELAPFGRRDLASFGMGMFVVGIAVMFYGLYLMAPVGACSGDLGIYGAGVAGADDGSKGAAAAMEDGVASRARSSRSIALSTSPAAAMPASARQSEGRRARVTPEESSPGASTRPSSVALEVRSS